MEEFTREDLATLISRMWRQGQKKKPEMPEAIESGIEGMICLAVFSDEVMLAEYIRELTEVFSKVTVYGKVVFTQTRAVHPIRGVEYTLYGKSLLVDNKTLWIFLHGFSCGRADWRTTGEA